MSQVPDLPVLFLNWSPSSSLFQLSFTYTHESGKAWIVGTMVGRLIRLQTDLPSRMLADLRRWELELRSEISDGGIGRWWQKVALWLCSTQSHCSRCDQNHLCRAYPKARSGKQEEGDLRLWSLEQGIGERKVVPRQHQMTETDSLFSEAKVTKHFHWRMRGYLLQPWSRFAGVLGDLGEYIFSFGKHLSRFQLGWDKRLLAKNAAR